MKKDNLVKFPKRFKFDKRVVDRFDDMISRSIPFHGMMREAVDSIASHFIFEDHLVVDIGCSTGRAIKRLVHRFPKAKFVGLETSEPMIDSFLGNFSKLNQGKIGWQARVGARIHDLRTGFPVEYSPTLVLSILTLQFLPINYRQQLVSQIFKSLRPGGAFILVEKILGGTAASDKIMIENYHAFKASNGYSYEQIERKKASLEGVLVPLTAEWNESILVKAGFSGVECFWRWMNFAGWVGIKS